MNRMYELRFFRLFSENFCVADNMNFMAIFRDSFFFWFVFSMNTFCSTSLPNDSYLNTDNGLYGHATKNTNQYTFSKSWSCSTCDMNESLMDSDESCTITPNYSPFRNDNSEYLFDTKILFDVSPQSSQSLSDNCINAHDQSHVYDKQIQLWQFLIELLMNEKFTNIIRWTHDNEYEFVIVQADNLARLWGVQTKKTNMTFEKFNRSLRFAKFSKSAVF
jgi:hypothetical protein